MIDEIIPGVNAPFVEGSDPSKPIPVTETDKESPWTFSGGITWGKSSASFQQDPWSNLLRSALKDWRRESQPMAVGPTMPRSENTAVMEALIKALTQGFGGGGFGGGYGAQAPLPVPKALVPQEPMPSRLPGAIAI